MLITYPQRNKPIHITIQPHPMWRRHGDPKGTTTAPKGNTKTRQPSQGAGRRSETFTQGELCRTHKHQSPCNTRPRLCEGHASLTTPINSVKPDKGAARWRALPHYQWTPPGPELGTSRMQFKNTSDVTLRTDKNRRPIRGNCMRNEGTTNSIPAHQARPTRGTRAITTRISHIIYPGHFLRCAKNVAIPTMQVQYLNKTKGNYVRNCSAHPTPRPRSGPPPTDTASNPAHTFRKVATKPTRFVHPSSWLPPPSTPTFPHQQAEISPQNQHVLSFNPFLAPRAILGTIKPGISATFR